MVNLLCWHLSLQIIHFTSVGGGLMPMADDDDRNGDSLLCILSPIARVTIPTSENGDVITVDVQDGLVFDSGVSRFTHIWIYDTVKHSEGEILTWVEAWNDNGQQTCGVRWGKYWLLLCHRVEDFERLIGAKGGFHFGHQQNSTLSVVMSRILGQEGQLGVKLGFQNW